MTKHYEYPIVRKQNIKKKNNDHEEEEKKVYRCEKCNAVFTHNSNLSRHRTQRCIYLKIKEEPKENKLEIEILKLQFENKDHEKQIENNNKLITEFKKQLVEYRSKGK